MLVAPLPFSTDFHQEHCFVKFKEQGVWIQERFSFSRLNPTGSLQFLAHVSPGQGVTLRPRSFASSNCPLAMRNQVSHHRREGRAMKVCKAKRKCYFSTSLWKAVENLSQFFYTHPEIALTGGLRRRNCPSTSVHGRNLGKMKHSIQTLPCSLPKPGAGRKWTAYLLQSSDLPGLQSEFH